MRAPRCRTCKFWDGWRRSGYGESHCRRRAPLSVERQPGSGGPHVVPMYPTTERDHWCGDHAFADDRELSEAWLLPGQENYRERMMDEDPNTTSSEQA